MDQVWKGLSNLDPRDPGGFYKKPLTSVNAEIGLSQLVSVQHVQVSKHEEI